MMSVRWKCIVGEAQQFIKVKWNFFRWIFKKRILYAITVKHPQQLLTKRSQIFIYFAEEKAVNRGSVTGPFYWNSVLTCNKWPLQPMLLLIADTIDSIGHVEHWCQAATLLLPDAKHLHCHPFQKTDPLCSFTNQSILRDVWLVDLKPCDLS